MMRCGHCGEKLKQKNGYCPHCGSAAGTAKIEPAARRKKRKGLLIGLICGELALILLVVAVVARYSMARPSAPDTTPADSGGTVEAGMPAGWPYVYQGYLFGESDEGDIKAAREMAANPVAFYPPVSIYVPWASWMTQTNGNYTELGGTVSLGEGRIQTFAFSLDGEMLCYLAYTQPGSDIWLNSSVPDGMLPSLFWGQSGGAQYEVAKDVVDYSFLPHNRALAYTRVENDNVMLCVFLGQQEEILAQGNIGDFCLSANGRYVLYAQDETALYIADVTGGTPTRLQNEGAAEPCAVSNDGCVAWYRWGEDSALVRETLGGEEPASRQEVLNGVSARVAPLPEELCFNYSGTEVVLFSSAWSNDDEAPGSLWVWRPSTGLTQCSDTGSDIVVPQGTELVSSFSRGTSQLLAEDFSTFFYVAALADYEKPEDDYNLHYGLYLWAEGGSQPVVEHFPIGLGGDVHPSAQYPQVNQDGTIALYEENHTLFRVTIENGRVGARQTIAEQVYSWRAAIDGNTAYYCIGQAEGDDDWPDIFTLCYWQEGKTQTMITDKLEDISNVIVSADGSKCAFIGGNKICYNNAWQAPVVVATFDEGAYGYPIALSNEGGLLYSGPVSNDGSEQQERAQGIYFYKDEQSTLLIDEDGYE